MNAGIQENHENTPGAGLTAGAEVGHTEIDSNFISFSNNKRRSISRDKRKKSVSSDSSRSESRDKKRKNRSKNSKSSSSSSSVS